MSKPSNPRREADNEAKAVLRTVRVSPRKLDLVAATRAGSRSSLKPRYGSRRLARVTWAETGRSTAKTSMRAGSYS